MFWGYLRRLKNSSSEQFSIMNILFVLTVLACNSSTRGNKCSLLFVGHYARFGNGFFFSSRNENWHFLTHQINEFISLFSIPCQAILRQSELNTHRTAWDIPGSRFFLGSFDPLFIQSAPVFLGTQPRDHSELLCIRISLHILQFQMFPSVSEMKTLEFS